MRNIIIICIGLFFMVILYISCQDKNAEIVTNPELSSANNGVERLKITIRTNDSELKTIYLQAIEWNGIENIASDKFYKIPDEKKESFEAKLEKQRGGKVKVGKAKNSSTELAEFAHGTGLSASAYSQCSSSSSWGTCQTTADSYYYSTKQHDHSYWGGGYSYFYSHTDNFSDWSDIVTEFNSGASFMHCSASVVRDDYVYKLNSPGTLTLLARATLPHIPGDSVGLVACPPFCPPTDNTWQTLAGDEAVASHYCD